MNKLKKWILTGGKGICRGVAFTTTAFFAAVMAAGFTKNLDIDWIWFYILSVIILFCASYGWGKEE